MFMFCLCSLEKKVKHQRRTIQYQILHNVLSEAVVRRCSVKKMFLKISQNSQEITCARVSSAGLRLATLLKRDSGTGVFL